MDVSEAESGYTTLAESTRVTSDFSVDEVADNCALTGSSLERQYDVIRCNDNVGDPITGHRDIFILLAVDDNLRVSVKKIAQLCI